jgi:hypothetical protein
MPIKSGIAFVSDLPRFIAASIAKKTRRPATPVLPSVGYMRS